MPPARRRCASPPRARTPRRRHPPRRRPRPPRPPSAPPRARRPPARPSPRAEHGPSRRRAQRRRRFRPPAVKRPSVPPPLRLQAGGLLPSTYADTPLRRAAIILPVPTADRKPVTESAHWIIAVTVAVLIGTAGTLYFRLVVMRRDETAAGLTALAAMSWRDFIHLVLDAMGRRGYSRVFDRQAPSGDDAYTLERDGKRYLLTCKHGSAFVLGGGQVAELGNAIRLANATGGILATQGSIATEARPAAKMQRIELLDGPILWPELRGLVDAGQLAGILSGAAAKARRRTLLSWLLGLVAGLAVFLALPSSAPEVQSPPPAAGEAPARDRAPTVAGDAPAPAPAA